MLYDALIIGGGPAGYTAALYCVRSGMSVLVLEQLSPGGQMAATNLIDNYPGFESGVDGFDLGMKMKAGADRFGAKTEITQVTALNLAGSIKKAFTSEGEFQGKTLIIATGASPRKLDLDNEEQLRGRGIAYCAVCDGMIFKGKTVIVVGGGNSAAADALFLTKICKKVYIVHRRNSLRASAIYVKPLNDAANLEFIWNSRLVEILTDAKSGLVRGTKLEQSPGGQISTIDCDGIFVAIGRNPNTEIFRGSVDLDKSAYIIADESCRTNIPGVFAIGDVRTKAMRQIVTACADGATVSKYVEDYLAQQQG